MHLTPGLLIISKTDGRFVFTTQPEDMEVPKYLLTDIRKIVRFFSRQRKIRKIRIRFSDRAEWGWELENGKDMVINNELTTDETCLMIIHELCHMILKMDHDRTSRLQLGYRSNWRRYRDRDVFSEMLSKQIFGRRLKW